MLSDKILLVLETMNVTISEVARAGMCTPSNLSRVKNGVRTPSPGSPTVKCLTDGLVAVAQERQVYGELAKLCGADLRDSKEIMRAKLIHWLFEDEPPYVRSYQRRESVKSGKDRSLSGPAAAFVKRLERLMNTVGISNRRLGLDSGVDPSYISRLRRGERMPRYNSPYLLKICAAIISTAAAAGKLSALSELTLITPEELSETEGQEALRRWLFGNGSVTEYMAADELMGTIASIDELLETIQEKRAQTSDIEQLLKKSEISERGIPCGDEEKYIGKEGLKAAVVRFLTEMIRNGEREILLYSDQPMDWMGGEFRKVLKVLMTELIRRDVKIRAIHTVNRSLPELVSAVEWWMPLYLSGKIESYHCMTSAGKRFTHTLFIRPGAACIAGTSAAGLEDRAIYSYSENKRVTELAEDAFDSLIQDSRPLVEIGACTGEHTEEPGFIQTNDLMVKAAADKVIVKRTKPPYLKFTFTHPMIIRAFRSYIVTDRYIY